MGTAQGMVSAMRSFVGIKGRPNRVTRGYASRNGSQFLSASWCDMTVTEAARASDNYAAVCPAGDRAFTVWHAQDFAKRGRWYPGTAANVNRAKPGDVVFFDWGYSDSIGAIDHVGVVVKALGNGYVQTIEGNTSNSCAVKERHYSVIAGYGRPDYDGSGGGSAPASGMLRSGSTGAAVRTLQGNLNKLGAKLAVDGDFGPATETAVIAFQRAHSLEVDGVVGPKTEAAITAALRAAQPKPAPKPAPKPKPSAGGAPKWPGRNFTNPPAMYGTDVRTWQTRMAARGWSITADGWYGPASADVCRKFQREKGLTVDGVVGAKTWAAAWTSPVA